MRYKAKAAKRGAKILFFVLIISELIDFHPLTWFKMGFSWLVICLTFLRKPIGGENNFQINTHKNVVNVFIDNFENNF